VKRVDCLRHREVVSHRSKAKDRAKDRRPTLLHGAAQSSLAAAYLGT